MRTEARAEARRRLARIAGQVSGVQKMLEDGRTCAELLQQVNALRSAIEQMGVLVLAEHLETCILMPEGEGGCAEVPADERVSEVRATIRRFLK